MDDKAMNERGVYESESPWVDVGAQGERPDSRPFANGYSAFAEGPLDPGRSRSALGVVDTSEGPSAGLTTASAWPEYTFEASEDVDGAAEWEADRGAAEVGSESEDVAGCGSPVIGEPPLLYRGVTKARSRNPWVGRAQSLLNTFLERHRSGIESCSDRSPATRQYIQAKRAALDSIGQDLLKVDCTFGQSTEIATMIFQACRGLVRDGKIGERTWRELLSLEGARPPLPNAPPASGGLVREERWQGTPAQEAFREAVMAEALARKLRARPPRRPQPDLPATLLRPVPGTNVAMRADAAEAAGRMLAAANADLAVAQRAGDPDARRTRSITATSGYRARAHQERLWRNYFKRYYNQTVAARDPLPGGPHGQAAVIYMLDTFHIPRKVAAPGYSNHQNGIAVDLGQVRDPGSEVENNTTSAALERWRTSWLHGWLGLRAREFGFTPYVREPWHWEYTLGPIARPTPTREADLEGLVQALLDEDQRGWEAPPNRFEPTSEYEAWGAVGERETDALSWLAETEGPVDRPWREDEEEEENSDPESEVWADEEPWLSEASWSSEDEARSSFEQEVVGGSRIEPHDAGLERTSFGGIAERVASGVHAEDEAHRPVRWTARFTAAEIAAVRQRYADNIAAAAAAPHDRASCIVMLNVGLGQLLSLRRKFWPARGISARRVEMADLPTRSIELAARRLVARGYARGPLTIDFFDDRGRQAGTRKPVRLRSSVRAAVLSRAKADGAYYAFAMSIMDGYHSVLLLVDRTGPEPVIEWFDQFSPRAGDIVTNTLDERLTTATRGYWQGVMDGKGVGYRTPVRLWQLRKRVP